MNPVEAATGGAPVQAGAAPTGVPAAPLLPHPEPLTPGGLDDAMSALYLAATRLGAASERLGEDRVRSEQAVQRKELADEQAAVQEQLKNGANAGRGLFASIGHLVGDVAGDAAHLRLADAVDDGAGDVKQAWNSPAFWNDVEKGAEYVAKVAAAVGSVALTVGTAGAAGVTLVGAAVLLSAGGEVVSQTKCLDGALGKGASQWVGAGMELCGAATGVTAGFVGTQAATNVVAVVSDATSGAASVVQGGAHVRNATFAARVQDAAADAQQAVDRMKDVDRVVGWVIDDIRSDHQTSRGTQEAIQGAIQTNDHTLSIAASMPLKG